MNSEKLVPIALRYTQDRKKNLISLKKQANPKDWIDSGGVFVRETGRDAPANAHAINSFLRSVLLRAESILLQAQLEDRYLSFAEFKTKLLNTANQDFYQFCEEELKRREQAGTAKGTMKTYHSDLRKLQQFRKTLSYSDITVKFLEDYEHHLTVERKNGHNTVFRAIKFIRTMLNAARKQKLTTVYPFDLFRLTFKKDTRDRLFREEVDLLHDIYRRGKLQETKAECLRLFLFSCYTGLSWGDLEGLYYDSVYHKEGEYFLKGKRSKTDQDYIVPLLEEVRELIDVKQGEGKIFSGMITNQKTNQYIQEICQTAGIKKKVTFHVARHTFGTVALNYGIPQEVVQKMMGHSTSAMTANYAKVMDQYVIKEMKKWQNANNKHNFLRGLSTDLKDRYKSLRIKIISTRISNGASEAEAAAFLKISEEDYQQLEKGKTEFGITQLVRLGEFLEVDLVELVG